MSAIRQLLIIIIITVFLSISVLGIEQKTEQVKVVFIINNDTTTLLDNSMIRFCSSKDTINIPVINQTFQLDRSINLKLTKIVLVVDNEEFSITTVGGDTFDSVFEKGMPSGTLTIQYYNRYDIAKKDYGKYITVNEGEFKSVTVWNYEWYFSRYI